MNRLAARSCLPLAVGALFASAAEADPISLEDLLATRPFVFTESFEFQAGTRFPAGLGAGGFGAPPAGFVMPSGIVFVSEEPNDENGLLVGEFNAGDATRDLGSNGVMGSRCSTLPRTEGELIGESDQDPTTPPCNAVFSFGGSAYATSGSVDAGEILFRFPIPVDGFGLHVSTLDQEPLLLRSYDVSGEEIETFSIEDSGAAPLREDDFRGLDAPPGREIHYFSVEGGTWVIDEIFFAEAPGCSVEPQPNCRTSIVGGSKLKIKGDRLSWKFVRGQETDILELGSLRRNGGAALCLYEGVDGESRLAAAAIVPADPELWSEGKRSVKYKDKRGSNDGVIKMDISTGRDGKTKVVVKGREMELPETPLGEDPPVLVQLKVAGGPCFQNILAAPAKRNDAKGFRGND